MGRSVTHNATFGTTAATGVLVTVVAVVSAYVTLALLYQRKRKPSSSSSSSLDPPMFAYKELIGETPLIKLPKLSALLKRQIFVKMESFNPGGTGKDRAALGMIRAAEKSGALSSSSNSSPLHLLLVIQQDETPTTTPTSPHINNNNNNNSNTASVTVAMDQAIQEAMAHSRTGGLVVEGTSGSTGISLATLCKCLGHACIVVMPDDQAAEKQSILRTLGAVVHVVVNVAISNPNHYVNIARKLAERAQSVFGIQATFIDQFENAANFGTHYTQTGPEILRQCPRLSAFVMSAGTGGTLSGVSRYLKENCSSNSCRTVLVDPPGSALYNKIMHGVAYARQQRERGLKRHRYDTLAEGIGLDRVTHNLALGIDYIDDAIQVSDQEAVDMAHWLLQTEGLWVGSSTAMNVVGAVRTALTLPEGSKVVTVVCDGGQRHLTRFWNREFCISWGLQWPGDLPEEERIPDCLRGVKVSL